MYTREGLSHLSLWFNHLCHNYHVPSISPFWTISRNSNKIPRCGYSCLYPHQLVLCCSALTSRLSPAMGDLRSCAGQRPCVQSSGFVQTLYSWFWSLVTHPLHPIESVSLEFPFYKVLFPHRSHICSSSLINLSLKGTSLPAFPTRARSFFELWSHL